MNQLAVSNASTHTVCAICLEDVNTNERCFSYSCMHEFCYGCLLNWSEIKLECPMCKTGITSILHNIKPNGRYDEYKPDSPRQLSTSASDVSDHSEDEDFDEDNFRSFSVTLHSIIGNFESPMSDNDEYDTEIEVPPSDTETDTTDTIEMSDIHELSDGSSLDDFEDNDFDDTPFSVSSGSDLNFHHVADTDDSD